MGAADGRVPCWEHVHVWVRTCGHGAQSAAEKASCRSKVTLWDTVAPTETLKRHQVTEYA